MGKHKGTVVLAVQERGEVLGLLAPGGIFGGESPGRIIAESHRLAWEEPDCSVTRGTWVQTHQKSGFTSSAHGENLLGECEVYVLRSASSSS